MTNCLSCGQALPDEPTVTSVYDIGGIRQAAQESGNYESEWFVEWEYLDIGDNIKVSGVPSQWTVKVIAENTEREYDSYGGYTSSDNYVIFVVSGEGLSQTYKLSGSYSSYDGWNWDFDNIIAVAQKPKTVLVWDAV